MPAIALLSDVHSNLPALEAVLRDVAASGAGQVCFLGDIVGYGASPRECVDWVLKLEADCVMGNHDAAMPRVRTPGFIFRNHGWMDDGYAAGLMHSGRSLDDAQFEWIKALPYVLEIPGAVIAHASLDFPQQFNYIECAASAAPTLELLEQTPGKVGFFGHTHIQDVFTAAGRGKVDWIDGMKFRVPDNRACAVTVGSVGQPRDERDRRACWALWDPDERTVEFRRVEFDRLKTVRQIIAAGLPLESALRMLHPGEENFLHDMMRERERERERGREIT